MLQVSRTIAAYGCMLLAAATLTANAAITLDDSGKFSVYGDGRLRMEKDWDSFRGDGRQRDDRTRMRIRARLGAVWKPVEFLEAGVRGRTGNDDHQQSGHITIKDFDDNPNGASDLNLDTWYIKANWRKVSAWVGRNSLPWWKQNDLFWDDDVTPKGAGLVFCPSLGPGTLTVNAGYYELPAGMRDYTSEAGSLQLVYAQDRETTGFTFAAGVMDIDADAIPGDYASTLLLQGNALRDYQLWVVQAQWRINNLPQKLSLGADYLHNSQSYSANDLDAFTAYHQDDVDGFVLQAVYGSVRKRGDWLLGLYYARLEALSIHNSYAQDDWVRWGSSDQTSASNMKGPEFRAGMSLGHNMNLIARLFIVDGIEKDLPNDVRSQTGNRARIDFNWSF
jgi:hypothetical protein